MLSKVGEEIIFDGAGGAIQHQHAARAALGGRLLRDQFLGKSVIEVGDTEVLRTLAF